MAGEGRRGEKPKPLVSLLQDSLPEVVTITAGLNGDLIHGPRSYEACTKVCVLQSHLRIGKPSWISVSLFQNVERIGPETSVGKLASDGLVELSAVFEKDFKVFWPGVDVGRPSIEQIVHSSTGDITFRVRPFSTLSGDYPDGWVGDEQSSSECEGIRDVLEYKAPFFEMLDFEHWLWKEKPEESKVLDKMLDDSETCEVTYKVFSGLSGVEDRLEALAGGYLWTVTAHSIGWMAVPLLDSAVRQLPSWNP